MNILETRKIYEDLAERRSLSCASYTDRIVCKCTNTFKKTFSTWLSDKSGRSFSIKEETFSNGKTAIMAEFIDNGAPMRKMFYGASTKEIKLKDGTIYNIPDTDEFYSFALRMIKSGHVDVISEKVQSRYLTQYERK